MSTLVIYKSKTGFTERYAHLIAEALSCECISSQAAKKKNLVQYDTLIYGGSLYASTILGLKKFIAQLTPPIQQSLFIFAVGLTPASQNYLQEITEHNRSSLNLPNINAKFFYLRGGLYYSQLNILDRQLIKIMKKTIEAKPLSERSVDECEMLKGFSQPLDFVTSESIQPLILAYKGVQ